MSTKRNRSSESTIIGEFGVTIELERARNTSGKETIDVIFTKTPMGDSRDLGPPTQIIKMPFDVYNEFDTVIRSFIERNRDTDPQR